MSYPQDSLSQALEKIGIPKHDQSADALKTILAKSFSGEAFLNMDKSIDTDADGLAEIVLYLFEKQILTIPVSVV